ncbi:hypothetical protein F5887DRAFT_957557 [Amanita rubescens]|nr:hypothetical protein F5887DRAFT_957557 [Amanita rubescens]
MFSFCKVLDPVAGRYGCSSLLLLSLCPTTTHLRICKSSRSHCSQTFYTLVGELRIGRIMDILMSWTRRTIDA